MAEIGVEMKESEKVFLEIMEHIHNGNNFLLSGGAGSGKTYTLVEVLKQVIKDNPTIPIVCITYTNAAVKEIKERVGHKNLTVLTIHDFLWDTLSAYKKDLKRILIELIEDPEQTRFQINSKNSIPDDYANYDVNYREFLRLREAIISHDELLILANKMYEKYPRLCDIFIDKCKFLFIDEYQDTSPFVINILLEHIQKSKRKNVIGFFGDSMQSIYEDGIGNIQNHIDSGIVKEVVKKQNRRNPKTVIDLSNKLRSDGIVQEPSDDQKAPNMKDGVVKKGSIQFIFSNEESLYKVRKHLGWTFDDSKNVKELNLTHNLIAGKAGFRILMDIYDKDPVIGLKNDILKKNKDLRTAGKTEIEILETDTFDNVVDKFQLKNKHRVLKKDVILENPESLKLYKQLKDLPFSIISKMYISSEQLIDDKKQDIEDENKNGSKRDNLIRHLFKIQDSISFYENKQYNDFLKNTGYRLNTVSEKKELKDKIDSLSKNVGNKTIEEVINEADGFDGKCIAHIDQRLEDFMEKNDYLYNRVKDVKYKEFQSLYRYLEGFTPFSTQHKIKGAEFENVLVILDNGGWNSRYNFENLFTNIGSSSVLNNSQKIFYVCCTRAKENLAVFFHQPKSAIIEKAKEWFGHDNVINLDKI